MRAFTIILFISLTSLNLSAQSKLNYTISTSDIDNFWIAFDSLATTKDSVKTIQKLYLDKGTDALRRFAKSRNYTAEGYALFIRKFPKFWQSIRPSTSGISARRQEIIATFEKIKKTYPRFKEPDVYFVIGCLRSGGTTNAKGVLIGAEISAVDASVVTSELPRWQKSVIGSTGDVMTMLAHEAIHTQQKLLSLPIIWGYLNHRLMTMSLSEGGADFASELATGGHINKRAFQYGNEHEAELWAKFKQEMSGNDISAWLYNGGNSDHPDLGYYVGYRICKSYYESHPDHTKALRKIIRMRHPKRFIKHSGYNA